MVQAKHKKSAPAKKKQAAVKSHGKKGEFSKFCSQLDSLGLKIIEVTSDGNCFFRALADQLDGDENEHHKYRGMVVEYIKRHWEDFEPFIEDEVPFDEYCKSMGEDGTWAGNMELQAASLVTRSNICIHHIMLPRWYIRNFHDHGSRMVHISYHDDEHYNSVRLKDDPCSGSAIPIIIKGDADVCLTTHQEKTRKDSSGRPTRETTANSHSIKLIMIGSGCTILSKVEEVLQEVGGDVDAAIEYLIAEREVDEHVHLKVNDIDGCNGQSSEHFQDKTEQDDQMIWGDEISHSESRKCPERAALRSAKSSRQSAGSKHKEKAGKRKKKVQGNRPVQDFKAWPDLGALCI